jgi:hypothetical protein
MLETIKNAKKIFDDFFEQHKLEIYSAIVLVLLVNVLIALPFTRAFLLTGQTRNYMIFGSSFHTATFRQFAWLGIQWLSFADIFIFLPAIIWSMLMPSIIHYFKKMQSEEE